MKKQAAPTYMVPFAHLEGTLAEMLFADAIYFLLATKGESNLQNHRFVETTTDELQTFTGLTRKTIRKQLDHLLQLDAPYRFLEEDGIVANGRLLKQCHYSELKNRRCLQKPQAFMQNFWGWVLAQPLPGQNKTSRFPYAILNILLRKPNGRTATLNELQKRTQKNNARKLPDLIHVQKAIAFLQHLNLVTEKNGEYQLNKAQFSQNGRTHYEQLKAPSTQKDTALSWQWAIAEAPERARLAQEIVELGQFDPKTHGKEIFYDLAHIQPETDLAWLKYAAHRHRHRLPGKQRWQNCWQLFQNRLIAQRYGSQSTKLHLKFYPEAQHTVTLTLPNHQPAQLRWGKLVVWVEDGRFNATGKGRTETVFVQLLHHKKPLWERIISYQDSVIRLDLTPTLKQTSTPIFQFHAAATRPMKQFSVDILLESEYITPP